MGFEPLPWSEEKIVGPESNLWCTENTNSMLNPWSQEIMWALRALYGVREIVGCEPKLWTEKV